MLPGSSESGGIRFRDRRHNDRRNRSREVDRGGDIYAERGAAIVDADQIAHDLQAPGARCSMRWPTGSVRTSSTSMVRSTAPRWPRRVQRRAGARRPRRHRRTRRSRPRSGPRSMRMRGPIASWSSTSRCSVRTRARGWRPRSSSTCRTRWPSSERVRGGMDEADVRNRIESQIAREQRLGVAAHVIDNGGGPGSARGAGRRDVGRTQRARGRRAGSGSSVMSTTGTSGGGVRRYHSAWWAPSSANAASTMSQ